AHAEADSKWKRLLNYQCPDNQHVDVDGGHSSSVDAYITAEERGDNGVDDERKGENPPGKKEPAHFIFRLDGHNSHDAIHRTASSSAGSALSPVRWTINCCNEIGTSSRSSALAWRRSSVSIVPRTVAETSPPNGCRSSTF